MDEKNRELLGKVIENRLERALFTDSEEDDRAFKEAMDAVGKQIEIDKMKAEEEKNLREEETKKKEARIDRIVQIAIFGSGLILGPIIEIACKKGYAKMLCEFEKDYTFTTTAGRGLSNLFRFKK